MRCFRNRAGLGPAQGAQTVDLLNPTSVSDFQNGNPAYNKRSIAEQWIKEGKQPLKMTWLGCHHFRSNEVRLRLSATAYDLRNLWCRLVLPHRIGNRSLTNLQQRLVKTGGRLVKHARYYWLMLAESHLTRRLFAAEPRSLFDQACGSMWEGHVVNCRSDRRSITEIPVKNCK